MFEHDDSLIWPTLRQVNAKSGRVYIIEDGPHKGKAYPSITRVLGAKPKPFLNEWRKRVGAEEAARITQKAASSGSALHRLMECYLGNEVLPEMSFRVAELWRYLRPWLDTRITKVYAQERDVYSVLLAVAGRLDLLADVDGKLCVVDLKNSLRPKREEWIEDYKIQGTFYACAVYEMLGLRPREIVFPVVSPEGLQEFRTTPKLHRGALMERIAYFYDHAA